MLVLDGEPAYSKPWAHPLVTGQFTLLLLIFVINNSSDLLELAILGLYYKQENNYSF